MTGFYMKCKTGQKWVKGKLFTPFKHAQTCHVPRPRTVQKTMKCVLHLNTVAGYSSQMTDMGTFLNNDCLKEMLVTNMVIK